MKGWDKNHLLCDHCTVISLLCNSVPKYSTISKFEFYILSNIPIALEEVWLYILRICVFLLVCRQIPGSLATKFGLGDHISQGVEFFSSLTLRGQLKFPCKTLYKLTRNKTRSLVTHTHACTHTSNILKEYPLCKNNAGTSAIC